MHNLHASSGCMRSTKPSISLRHTDNASSSVCCVSGCVCSTLVNSIGSVFFCARFAGLQNLPRSVACAAVVMLSVHRPARDCVAVAEDRFDSCDMIFSIGFGHGRDLQRGACDIGWLLEREADPKHGCGDEAGSSVPGTEPEDDEISL